MATTESNLKEAFAGESQANRKYLAFAKKAEQEGFSNVARLFRTTAEAETIHALGHLGAMDGVRRTLDNVRAAMAGETYEYTEMYPSFRKTAVEEGNSAAIQEIDEQIAESKEHAEQFQAMLVKAAKRFAALANVEERHANRYKKALESAKAFAAK